MTDKEAFNIYYTNHLKLQTDQFDIATATEIIKTMRADFYKKGYHYVCYNNTAELDIILNDGKPPMLSATYYSNYGEAQIARLRWIIKYNDISEYNFDLIEIAEELSELAELYPEYVI